MVLKNLREAKTRPSFSALRTIKLTLWPTFFASVLQLIEVCGTYAHSEALSQFFAFGSTEETEFAIARSRRAALLEFRVIA